MSMILIGGIAAVALVGVAILVSLIFRRVVPTNMVHIVQSSKKTTSYGTGQAAGNVYYEWPASLPVVGVTVSMMPVSNFDLELKGYTAYDKDRVPFAADITAFFQIEDTNIAAQRVENFSELRGQLQSIVQGAVRKILASDNIDSIMLERSKFGEEFTKEVAEELKSWGVKPVKNMELMDIRDAEGSQVIENIMAKKKSKIEMESRVEVAQNRRDAEIAEIEAKQSTDVRDQEAAQIVGQRTADKDREVGIANERAQQDIKEQQRETAERNMAIRKVEEVRQAEIDKEKAIVKAGQDRETTVIIADGELEAERKSAEGIKVKGEAEAEAKKLMELAPIRAQIELAQEIGDNEGYQQYLILLEAIAAQKDVGIAQANALVNADLKVIANAGGTAEGVNTIAGALSAKGGTNMAAMLESLAQSPLGKQMIDRLTGSATAGIAKAANGGDTPPSTPTGGDNA